MTKWKDENGRFDVDRIKDLAGIALSIVRSRLRIIHFFFALSLFLSLSLARLGADKQQ